MTKNLGISKGGFAIAALIAAAMCCATLFFAPGWHLEGMLGLCLPSPNLWQIPRIWSWGANTLLLALCSVALWLLNRHYNFIRSTEPVLPAMFIIMAASCPFTDAALDTSTLICLANILSIGVLFSCYRKENATQEMFIIGTFVAIGSMTQYAFIPFLLPFCAGALVMKAFRIKEFLALGMGLIAPYWIGLGFGLITPGDFRLPELSNLFDGFADSQDLFTLLLAVGITAFFGFFLGLNNSIKLYAGNSRINALNLVISMTGLTATACMVIDFSNMTAYWATLCFASAAQIANLCALWNIRLVRIVCVVPAIIYIALFLAMLFG